jgi:RHS repeat-associated protein
MTLEDWLTFPLSGDRAWEYYYNDDWQLLESRRSAGGAPQRDQRYAWSLRYLDAPIFRDTTEYPGGVPTAGDRLYYLTDPKMNVTCLVDDSGTAVERYLYDPYGTPLYFDGGYGSRSASAYENEILFSGYRQDPATGLYHVRFRDYHPRLGRWLTTDPMAYAGGYNRYDYVRSRPTSESDPSGLLAPLAIALIAGVAIGGGVGGAIGFFTTCGTFTQRLRGALHGAIVGGVVGGVSAGTGFGVQAFLGANAFTGAFGLGVGGVVGDIAGQGVSIGLGDQQFYIWQQTALAGGFGVVGGSTFWRAGTGSTQLVTQWGTPSPWYQIGGNSRWNRILSGTFARGRHFAARSSGTTLRLSRSRLAYPSGWESVKGLFGQRILIQ